MVTRKHTRAAKAQSRNRSPVFLDVNGQPIAGAPPPLPCPFCGATQVYIFVEETGGEPTALAHCEHCGTDCGYSSPDPQLGLISAGDCVLDAAGFWNTRALGTVIPFQPRRSEEARS